MTQIWLAVCNGALATLLLAMLLLHRRSRRQEAVSRRALEACVLWWWHTDTQGLVRQVHPGRDAGPDFLREALLGRMPGQVAGSPQPPAAIAVAMAARRPFHDIVVAPASRGQAPIRLSGAPVLTPAGRFLGYAGAALRADSQAAETAAAERAALRQRLGQLERERREQARQFELSAREMESFSYSVSHDLRAPLRVVDGFANIVLEDYGPRLDVLGRQHVQRIVAAAARMNAMIDALLALSRRTGQALNIEPVDLSGAARELADELARGERGRAVEFRIEPGLHAPGDPALLRLVLQNLLGNAVKFSAKAPQALVEFGHHVVEGSDVYFVRDNGAGFDMRFAEHLFGLFQRFHPQNDYPGTGVGLATVQRIVRKHGGRIWAESEPGRGACFYFTLATVAARSAIASAGSN